MITPIAQTTLKSGEPVDLLVMTAPEPRWLERLQPFLAHKGPRWNWPIREAMTTGLPPLSMRFYLCLSGETVVGNITTVEALEPPVGLLQHVFTDPQHRRKGICQLLMKALGDDFVSRGGRAMYLGTEYDSPPYWIYDSFGYQGLGETGAMRWLPEADFDAAYFRPGPVSVRASNWGDWPLLNALYLQTDGGWFLRGLHWGQFGFSSYEEPQLRLAKDLHEGRVSDSRVMVTAAGALVGHAFIRADDRWAGQPWLLDCFVHPAFTSQLPTLLQSLDYPADRPIWACGEAGAEGKAEALQAAGFVPRATLPGLLQQGSNWLDLVTYKRE